ncbi:hypothetical protein BJ322DRAFT_857686 [Thelephora terrestris]|uniref:Uncharacterized protein n=1 Tax=Thelephora terrestris TaxID=56493 RepID=A0A9P6HD62_9AGAM|nr:hypothetical protein BJ322DRAFT_857686 [Thelephora terrestris]
MGTGFDDFFAQQEKLMALPEEDVDSYLARRAKHDEPPYELGNMPSLLSDSELLADPLSDPDPVDGRFRNPSANSQGDTNSIFTNAADPVASPLPRTPVKGSAIDQSDEPAPAASRSRRDLSPRRIVLTKQKRAAPTLKIVQSSPIDTFSPVASSTPARPPLGKVVEESPLLGKRPRDEADTSPSKTKHKSKGKGKAVYPSPQYTSPIESPRFDTSAPGPTGKRPRESGGSPGPAPKRKTLRTDVLPTSPINSAVFPPNIELPPVLSWQGSVTVSSDQSHEWPRDDRVIKIKSRLPPLAEVSVADTSVIESFDTSPHKPPTAAKRTGPVNNEKNPQVPVKTAAVETSFLTSPVTSPEKQSTILPPPPPPLKTAQRAQVKNVIADSTVASITSPENSRDEPTSNGKGVADLIAPPPGQAAKTIGITKLRPAATTTLLTETGPSKSSSTTMPLRSKSTLGQVQKKKIPIIPAKKGKEKPPRMTPVEYADMLIEKNNNPNRKIPNVSQHLRGRKIFYAGVDMRYAGDATKKKMEYVRTPCSSNVILIAHNPGSDYQVWRHASP